MLSTTLVVTSISCLTLQFVLLCNMWDQCIHFSWFLFQNLDLELPPVRPTFSKIRIRSSGRRYNLRTRNGNEGALYLINKPKVRTFGAQSYSLTAVCFDFCCYRVKLGGSGNMMEVPKIFSHGRGTKFWRSGRLYGRARLRKRLFDRIKTRLPMRYFWNSGVENCLVSKGHKLKRKEHR